MTIIIFCKSKTCMRTNRCDSFLLYLENSLQKFNHLIITWAIIVDCTPAQQLIMQKAFKMKNDRSQPIHNTIVIIHLQHSSRTCRCNVKSLQSFSYAAASKAVFKKRVDIGASFRVKPTSLYLFWRIWKSEITQNRGKAKQSQPSPNISRMNIWPGRRAYTRYTFFHLLHIPNGK